jgi:hypothetical protein
MVNIQKSKTALRIISNTPRRSSTIHFCKQNLIFRLPDIHKNAIGLLMFKYNHGLLPDIFTNFFSKNKDHHSHHTKNATKLRIPSSKTHVGSKFITNTGVGFWNHLENIITTNLQIGAFKKLLKNVIINT